MEGVLKDYITKIKIYTALKLCGTAYNYRLSKEWSITTFGLSFKEEWDTFIMWRSTFQVPVCHLMDELADLSLSASNLLFISLIKFLNAFLGQMLIF